MAPEGYIRVAYLDPPYLGCCSLYKHDHGRTGGCWDDPETHRYVIDQTAARYPDGWALSCSTPSLQTLLSYCPPDVRVGAWVKSFAVYKPNVNPAYAWEPVIYRGGRKRKRSEPTVRDWVCCPVTLRRGLTGAKPEGFCFWLFELLNLRPGDIFDDRYPGTGAVSAAWLKYQNQLWSPEALA